MGSVSTVLFRLIKQTAGLGFVLIFLLYTLGYIILTTHLDRFGIRPRILLSFDCIGAALCYIGFVVAVALPAWLISHRFLTRSISLFGRDADSEEWKFIAVLILIWNLLLSWGASDFLSPQVPTTNQKFHLPWWLYMGCGHLLTIGILKWTKKLPKLNWFISLPIWGALYLTVPTLTSFVHRPEVDGFFVLSTIFLYLLATNIENLPFGLGDRRFKERSEVQLLLGIVWILIVISNAVAFGKTQYARLPGALGGGAPTEVLIRSDPNTIADLKSFGVKTSGNQAGPALLLFRTDNEICLVTNEHFSSTRGGAMQIRRELVSVIYAEPQASPTPFLKPKPRPAPGKAPSPSPTPSPTSHLNATT